MSNLGDRIIVLVDMDCFFCQVETRLQPEFAGKPLAVVQYNQWKLGGIIAVNYQARDYGVTRHMRGEEAKEKCPELLLASVPCLRGKADTSRYRSAGREVIDVLKKNCNIVERASVDEAYLDITQIVDDKLSKEIIDYEDILEHLKNTFVVGHSPIDVNDEDQRKNGLETWLTELSEDIQIQRLSIAGTIVENLRKEIYEITGFRCSAGISFNKILAKLACGLHKPNRQTILPASAVPELFGTLPVKKVRNLGGKLGDIVMDSLKCNVMGDILRYSLQYLQNRFDEKTGMWLYNIARGIDSEPVTPRLVSKSIGACKKFPGKQAIVDVDVLKHWLGELSEEVCERLEQDLEENERRATLLTVSFQYYQNKNSVSQSRSNPLTSYKPEKVTDQCLSIVTKAVQQLPVSFLGISVGKFVKAKGSENFMNFFKTNAIDKLSSTMNEVVEYSKASEEVEKLDTMHTSTEGKELEVQNIKSSNTVKSNRRSSPCSKIQSSLKTDNFKKSFFMNILKEKQSQNENFEKDLSVDKCSDTFDQNEPHKDLNSNSKDSIKNDSEVILPSFAKTESQFRSSSSDNQATVRLQEIFPDLKDIDVNIVKLLPFNLQQEANKLLKEQEKNIDTCDKNIESTKVKSKETNKPSKGKISKCKSNNQESGIQNFFIKTDAKNESDDNLKKCSQCDQLILVSKFDEHNDYHVAKNLQKEINRIPSNNDESRKRKVALIEPNHLKKRLSDEMVNNVSKGKSISSFFQQ